MHGTDAGAGEHGIGSLGDHRHVDGDAVTFLDAVLLQHIRQTADIVVELVIGDLLVDIGIVAFPDDRRALAMRLQMPVDTVVGDVRQAVLEPLDRHPSLEGGVLDLGIGLEPVDPPAVLVPEFFRILDALLIPFLVPLIVDERAGFRGFEHRVDFGRHKLLLKPSMSCYERALRLPPQACVEFIAVQMHTAIRQRSFVSQRIAILMQCRYRAVISRKFSG